METLELKKPEWILKAQCWNQQLNTERTEGKIS